MRSILLIAFALAIASCSSKRNEEFSMNDPGVPISLLIDSIENHGSVGAFHSLETASLDYHAGTFLSTFLIMADKYNNAFACMSVYYQIVDMYNVPLLDESENGIFHLDSLNYDARKMAIRYLVKADSLGNKEAKDHLLEYKRMGLLQ